MTKGERTRALRYKRPALASMGWEHIQYELDEISAACDDVRWFIDGDGGFDSLVNALDGEEDEAFEFKIAFSDLSARCELLGDALRESCIDVEQYDDCTVALIGNRYNMVGYDADEEDYFSLVSYEQELATTEAGKRLMRLTKAEMVSTIGQCVGAMLAFYDLRQQYDYLKATMDILRNENTSMLKTIKEIEAAYETAAEDDFREYGKPTRTFDHLISALPDRAWLE